MSKLIYPLTILSDVEMEKISKGIFLRKITNKELEAYFGIKTRKFDENNKITKMSIAGSGYFGHNVAGLALSNLDELYSSNYVIEICNDSDFKKENSVYSALKIGKLTLTGISVGFDEETHNMRILKTNPYCKMGLHYLSLKRDQLSFFSNLFELIYTQLNNGKVSLILEKYLYSVSGVQISDENRFLEMAIVLEMILLPKMNDELSYRFSLRGSRLLNRFISQDKKEGFNLMRTIYGVRSKLVHEGRSIKLNRDLILRCQEITSLFIRKYLEENTLFSNEKLDEVCID